MTRKKRDVLTIVSDSVLIGAATLSIGISLLDFLGLLDSLPWLAKRVQIMILLSTSFLLLAIVVERKARLDTIQRSLDGLVANTTIGTKYMDDAESVLGELERAAHHATESIMALGGRAKESKYLNAIRDAVNYRHVIHYRLIDGTSIHHELHEHLLSIIDLPNVKIAWKERGRIGYLMVTENDCIMAFPAPYEERFSGLSLPGTQNCRKYTQYFLEDFSKCIPVEKSETLQALCIDCSPESAGNATAIREILHMDLS